MSWLIRLTTLATALLATVTPALAWESRLYGPDWQPTPALSFATDKILQDFSSAGYMRSNQPLPALQGSPVFNAVQHGADPTGNQDITNDWILEHNEPLWLDQKLTASSTCARSSPSILKTAPSPSTSPPATTSKPVTAPATATTSPPPTASFGTPKATPPPTPANTTHKKPPVCVASQQSRYGYVIGTRGRGHQAQVADDRQSTLPVDHLEGEGQGQTLIPSYEAGFVKGRME